MDDMDSLGTAVGAAALRPAVKRTYGRRREPALDTSILDSTVSTGASSRASSNDPPSLEPNHEYPPTSDGPDASASSPASFDDAEASNEDNDRGDALPSGYEFDWKKKLREMDEDDDAVQESVKDASSQRPIDSKRAASPQPSSPAVGIPSAETRETDDLSHVNCDESSKVADSPVASRSPSPVVRRRPPRRKSLAPRADSDSESSDALDKSPLRAVLSRLPSPAVLPTSLTAKAKGKQKAIVETDSDDDESRTSKRRRNAGKGRQTRVKPPTKKEREETQKATARMMAERDATLPRAQGQQFELSHFLEKLSKPSKLPVKVNKRVEVPDTDPIQPFSSSPSSHVPQERPNIPLRARSVSLKPLARAASPVPGTSFKPTGLLGLASTRAGGSDDSSEDEEMPDIESLLHEEAKKREEQERLQRAAETKRRFLKQQQNRVPTDDEDGSDLEIVHEDMHADAAAPSFQRKKTHDAAVKGISVDELNHMMLRQAQEQAVAERRQKEEQWQRAGGKLKNSRSDTAPAGFEHAVTALIQKRLTEVQTDDDFHEDEDEDRDGGEDEDEDDPDYQPADENQELGSGDEANSDTESQPVLASQVEMTQESENDDENVAPVPRGRKGRPRRPLVAIHSDDEEEGQPEPLGRVLVADSSFALPGSQRLPQGTLRRRTSTSSLENHTEDGTDKENDASLMYDRGEDKENTVVSSQSGFSRAGSIFSLSQNRPFSLDDGLPMESTPQDGRRAPFQELPTGDDDENPFSFSSDLQSPARRLTFSPGPPLPSLRSDENAPAQAAPASPPSVRPVALKGGLADLFESQASNKVQAPAVVPKAVQGGDLSDFFSQQTVLDEAVQIKGAKAAQDLSLTMDVALQPALDISQTLRRKADEIFDKEQELIAEGANKGISPEKKRIFLTQTRPMRTPVRSQLFSPTQVARVSGMSIQDVFSPRSVTRQPLATIDAVMTNNDDDDDFDAQPRMRLKRRKISPEKGVPSGSRAGSVSPTPHKPKDVFAIMRQASMHPMKLPALLGKKAKRSEFIEGEAEESDDDDMRGFGLRKRNDEEEEDDEAQDQNLQELVDDQEMDQVTLAEDAVLEKHREQLEQDDQENERLHQNAVQGKLRTARRNRGVGFEDDDSDEDDDDAARARRRMQRQKRKIDGDTLDVLAQDPGTAPFAQAYQDGMTEDDDFAHMEQNDDTLIGMDVDTVEEGQEEQEKEVVGMAQLRKELVAASREDQHTESLDPHDVSWFESDGYEEEETHHVKEFSGSSKNLPLRKDGDWDPSVQSKFGEVPENEKSRMLNWAKHETRVYGTGRTTASVSVTGGARKRGGVASRGTGRTAAHGPKQTNKVAKTPSVLSTVSTSRRAKFQG
ncbi:MRC1-like domain-containing protein [Fomitopsis serialis]|uniref:MRC1-like domain-containing protein n=1 Tax=Fomitopsis serialis TaxID=139415 RepID=UPI0020077CA2|nr:MRC1-like domain-containing protein [Neoantrodia serialis]KAH9938582.1 MRC1-like domain-containing protein [Neoantrodia serialis]